MAHEDHRGKEQNIKLDAKNATGKDAGCRVRDVKWEMERAEMPVKVKWLCGVKLQLSL